MPRKVDKVVLSLSQLEDSVAVLLVTDERQDASNLVNACKLLAIPINEASIKAKAEMYTAIATKLTVAKKAK